MTKEELEEYLKPHIMDTFMKGFEEGYMKASEVLSNAIASLPQELRDAVSEKLKVAKSALQN